VRYRRKKVHVCYLSSPDEFLYQKCLNIALLTNLYLFITSDSQFGFKKGRGCTCSYAIRTARQVVDNMIKGGNTANICAIYISKAFDRVNHHGLLTKLM